jgi:hypothetical protein
MGQSRVTCWTWCTAGYEIDVFNSLMQAREITGATLVIDHYGEQRQRNEHTHRKGKAETQGFIMRAWIDRFGPGSVKVCRNHAKMTTIDNGRLKIVIHGSANLNRNPRFEQFQVQESPELHAFIERMERELPVLSEQYTNAEVIAATGLQSLFSDEELKPFFTGGLKAWSR